MVSKANGTVALVTPWPDRQAAWSYEGSCRMSTTVAAKPRKRKPRIILTLLFVLLPAACLLAGILWLQSLARDGTRLTFGDPGGASATSTTLAVEVVPDLADRGLAAKCAGVSVDVEQIAFVRKERHAARIEVSTSAASTELDGLIYVLYDETGRELNRGPLPFSGTLKAGETQTQEIPDFAIGKARRLVIRR
jgi:hypothetical protein